MIPEAAETVERIFQLKQDGFGKRAIEKKLNADATWMPPGRKGRKAGWHCSYIEKILRSRAVIGEFQPHRMDKALKIDRATKKEVEKTVRVPDGDPIPNYFPAILEPDLFHAVQDQMDRIVKLHGNGGGRTGKAKNVFVHLGRCAYCGGPMVLLDKGNGPKGGCYQSGTSRASFGDGLTTPQAPARQNAPPPNWANAMALILAAPHSANRWQSFEDGLTILRAAFPMRYSQFSVSRAV